MTYKTGVTHAGVFHADDVFSAALLMILNPEIEIRRVMRAPDGASDDTIVFDIGFGRYDHHQRDGAVRANGAKYAAFGLLWREFGPELVSDSSAQAFDKTFVQSLDDADNGGAVNAMYQAIASFVPNWADEDQNMDTAFFKAVDFARAILEREIARMVSIKRAHAKVQYALDHSDGEIVILDRFVPWQDVLIPTTAKFVVFPSLRGGWSAQAIPTTLSGRDQKVPFPETWAGAEKDVLQTYVPGMTFCHPGRFIIGAETLAAAIQACGIAMEEVQK